MVVESGVGEKEKFPFAAPKGNPKSGKQWKPYLNLIKTVDSCTTILYYTRKRKGIL